MIKLSLSKYDYKLMRKQIRKFFKVKEVKSKGNLLLIFGTSDFIPENIGEVRIIYNPPSTIVFYEWNSGLEGINLKVISQMLRSDRIFYYAEEVNDLKSKSIIDNKGKILISKED